MSCATNALLPAVSVQSSKVGHRFAFRPVSRLLVFLVALLTAAALFGQRETGTISGDVVDPNGAVVPGVSVALKEQRTGFTKAARTNAQGYYLFLALPVGVYELSVEAPGFKKTVRSDIALQVTQNLTVRLPLQLGEVAETVTITAAPPQVDVTSGAVKAVVGSQFMTTIPLNNRNVFLLTQLAPGAGPGTQFNGGVGWSNNYTMDGAEAMIPYSNNIFPLPNPDAIQEFSVLTSSYGAEYGRNRSAVVNVVTKSGTNDLHVNLFEFLRNNRLDARNFFATGVPPFKRNQFGGTAGGPIKKDKLFYFFSWQSTLDRGSPNVSTFPTFTEPMRRGDFSALTKAITDPLTGQAFSGNQIPQNRWSKAATAFIQQYVPLPNLPGGLYSAALQNHTNTNDLLGRFDYELSSNDRISGRYNRTTIVGRSNGGSFEDWFQTTDNSRHSINLRETHIFSPGVLNSFAATYNRIDNSADVDPRFDWATLGANIPPATVGQHGWVGVTLSGYFNGSNGVPSAQMMHVFNFSDTLDWIKGRHHLKFGTQITRYRTHNIFEYQSAGVISFNGQYTGNGAADFLLGTLASMNQSSSGRNDLRQTLWGFFAQDDVRVTPRFTVNLGLRWEPYLGFYDKDGESTAFRPGQQSTVVPKAPRGLLFLGDPNVNPNFFRPDWNNLAPRVGFAWDLFGDHKTAVRGGYGVYYDSIASIRLNRFPLNQPFLLGQSLNGPLQLDDPYKGNSPFPYTPPITAAQKAAFNFILPASITTAESDICTPYSMQWNFTIERQLPARFTVSSAYVGARSLKLYYSMAINAAPYAPGASTANIQQRRLYPQFAGIEDEKTDGFSNYHSWQVWVRRQFHRGLSVTTAYTLSKNTGLAVLQSEGNANIRDINNMRLDKGLLQYDVTHALSTSFFWEIPAPFQARLLRFALGGWELGGIFQAQTGQPFTVKSGVSRAFTSTAGENADYVPGQTPDLTSGSRGQRMQRWFNTSAFGLATIGTFGNVAPNTMRAPGMWNLDQGIYKNFRFREKYRLQYRAEFFNIFNNVNLGAPNASVSSATFGKILSAGTPRVIEMALKFNF